MAVSAPAASTNGYGTYALSVAGVWTYALDNSNATVQALNADADADRQLHHIHEPTAPNRP